MIGDGIYVIKCPKVLDPFWSEAINSLGRESGKSQKLENPITSTIRISSLSDTVYIIVIEGKGKGLLRVGNRTLFFPSKDSNELSPFNPLCVLDFYVKKKRRGYGTDLFEAMLSDNKVNISSLAFDRPSSDMLAFLKNTRLTLQANRFSIVIPDFYSFNTPSDAANGSPSTVSVSHTATRSASGRIIQYIYFNISFVINIGRLVRMEDYLRVAGKSSTDLHLSLAGVRVVGSSMESCLTSIDCFGRALAVDTAYRHLTSAEQYLMDAQKMQDSAPHTDVQEKALNYIDRAKEFLRPYAVSEDNASCRDPPVCVVDEPTKKAQSCMTYDPLIMIASSERIKNSKLSPFSSINSYFI
jgi:hypothetical protein